ncbi:MAG: glycosyltransferase [Candidatus Magnetomorum sp.]|nr:glycosyltransferase [Candidatus Magnetomorum sp.]
MKVLHISKYYPPFAGGIEHFAADLHESLCRQGIQSYVVAHQHQSTRQLYTKSPSNVYFVPVIGTILYTPVSPMFPKILLQTVQQLKPDVIHIHMPNLSAFWMLLFKSIREIPWVIHWHSDVVASKIDKRMSFAYPLYQPFEYQLLKHARTIIATTHQYLMTSPTLFPFRHKCQVIPLGVSRFRFKQSKIQSEQLWDKHKYKVLSIGRLTYYKGYDVLIKAAACLPDCQFIIVGEGEMRASLEQLISQTDVTHNIKPVGFVKTSQIAYLLSTCDCLCLPSLERTEAFGLVLLEAMLFSKPVVASCLPGPSWIVEHKKTGLLIEPGNVNELVHALKLILRSPDEKKIMGQAAYHRFFSLFEIDQVSKQIRMVYKNLTQ